MSGTALKALKNALRARAMNAMASANIGKFRAPIEIEEARSRDWASATFTGEQHHLSLRLEGPAAAETADALLNGLTDAEFDLGRHVLIDIGLVTDERRDGGEWARLTLEALTVEGD